MLYLAVKGSSPGILGANVYLFQEKIIRIMHISAALGTAEYIQEDGSWSLSRNFDWKHRLTGNGDAALTERENYFNEEGWAAPNARTGQANHLEMQILVQSGSKIAISLIDPGSNDRIVWPAGLDDDTGMVFSTGLPTEINLEPDGWHLIE
jgi:hypothetical protein